MIPDNISQFWASLEIAKFLTSSGLRATVASIRDFFATPRARQIAPEVQTIFLTDEGIAFVGTLMTIGQPILDYVTEEIERAEAGYVACLRSSTTPGQRNKCDRDAEKLICETLDRAKNRNGGVLPAPFEPVWTRYGCA